MRPSFFEVPLYRHCGELFFTCPGLITVQVMKQLTAGVCAESTVVSLWEGCGLKWEELGIKGDELRELLTREVRRQCMLIF